MRIFKLKHTSALTMILLFILGSASVIDSQNTLGQRNTLNLWDAASGTQIHSFEIGDYIWQATLNSDSTIIAARHDGGTLVTYDVQSGRVLDIRTFAAGGDTRYTLIRPGPEVNRVFVLQDENFWLWDFVRDEILLEGKTEGQLTNILVSPDGQRFLTVTRLWQIAIYDAASGNKLASTPVLPPIRDVQWHPDSTRIAIAHHEGYTVFDSETGAKLLSVKDDRFADVYSKVSWSPDGMMLLALASPSLHYEDTEIFGIDGETLLQKFSIPFDRGVFSLDWSADSSRILTAGYETAGVISYDASTGNQIHSYSGDPFIDGFLSAGWNDDASLIVGAGVVGVGDSYIVWEAETGRRVQEGSFEDSLMDIVWNMSRTHVLMTVWPDSVVDVIDLTQPDAPRFTLVHQDTLQGAVWSADSSRILTWTGRDIG